jgi:hypothetical protein
MTFDNLWWAERRDDKARRKLREEFELRFGTEKLTPGERGRELASYFSASDQINEAERLRTRILIRKAVRADRASKNQLHDLSNAIRNTYLALTELLRRSMN